MRKIHPKCLMENQSSKLLSVTPEERYRRCLELGITVLMFDGSIKKMEDIKIGEQVMGPDSKPRNVLSKYTRINNMYEIIPAKGRSRLFSESHILTLKGIAPSINLKHGTAYKYMVVFTERGIKKTKQFLLLEEAQIFMDSLPEDIFDISLAEFMSRSKNHQSLSFLYHAKIEFREKEIPIDSWMIGYWIGDGTASGTVIITPDHEVIDYFKENLPQYNLRIVDYEYQYQYRIVSTGIIAPGCNKFMNALRDLNILDNKHIPDLYKINSRKIRLELLAGLIDSDGYVEYGTNISISQVNKQTSDDIEYLAFSLGFMITRVEREGEWIYKGKNKTNICQYMEIFGTGTEEILTVIDRKKCNSRKMDKRATCHRFKIEPKEQRIYSWLELDGDKRFLFGNFLVAHC